MSTIFTKIINREIPGEIVYEDDHVVAFKDIVPFAPVHIIIVTIPICSTLQRRSQNSRG